MRQFVARLQVDVASLLRRKITEKQIGKTLTQVLENAGYSVAKQISFGNVISVLTFDECSSGDNEKTNLFYWLDIKKDGYEFVALFKPFVPFIYITEKSDVFFAEEFSYAKFDFLLGYSAGGGALQTAHYLKCYKLRCWIRLGLLWGGVNLFPTAVIEESIHLPKPSAYSGEPLSKVFASLTRGSVSSKVEYNFGAEDVADLVKGLKF